MRVFVALVLGASACLAQTITPVLPVFFPLQVKEYLGLSPDQISKILGLNSALGAFRLEKTQRQFQVQQEIADETARPSPDPMALGVRYFELEALRRQLDTQQKSTITQIQALLTADQKTKLAALVQALSLYSTACSAISQNLMSTPEPFPGNIVPANRIFDPATGSSPTLLFPTFVSAPCSAPTVAIRNGDFSALLP